MSLTPSQINLIRNADPEYLAEKSDDFGGKVELVKALVNAGRFEGAQSAAQHFGQDFSDQLKDTFPPNIISALYRERKV